jgi:hypothetical protein
MRHAGNFNPEWGCLAPAPGFMRTLRIILVAAAVGASAGAAVVFSLIERPAAETSVAARTLVQASAASTSESVQAPAPEYRQSPQPPAGNRTDTVAAAESRTSSTPQGPASVAALAEAPAATDSAPAPASKDVTPSEATPVQKKVAKKHSAPRSDQAYQPFGGSRGFLALLPSFSSRTAGGNPLWGQY